MSQKPEVGTALPQITVPKLGGGDMTLGQGDGWQMVVVYRGKHCPLCKKYLGQIEGMKSEFGDLGVSISAVSGDPEEKAKPFIEEAGFTGPVGYDLSLAQMKELGLYISDPRSPEETDRPFAEPALFVINPDGKAQIVDISNAPFARPELATLKGGLQFVMGNDYPVRGTHAA